MDAVGELDLRGVRVNERGTGDAQYPPPLLLGLLIYREPLGIDVCCVRQDEGPCFG